MLVIPAKSGKCPAILRVPCAGVRPYTGDTILTSYGFITLETGVHVIPVNLDSQVYKNLPGGALSDYANIRLNDKNRIYYRRIYLGCIRALGFIFNLPEFNGSDIAVTGRSQGGSLSIVTAALDRRIKFIAIIYPALCDLTGYLKKRAGADHTTLRMQNQKQEN
jgi:cephalosporin-C deacetylase-like acetyl esterase